MAWAPVCKQSNPNDSLVQAGLDGAPDVAHRMNVSSAQIRVNMPL